MTGRCSYSTLKSFISTARNLQVTSQYRLTVAPEDTNVLLSDSYMVFSCISGYTNSGGGLNVTCLGNGSWTQFPNCILSTQTTTISPSNGVPCTYNSGLLTITNGYPSFYSGVMSPTATQALSGAYIDYACLFTYTLVGNSRMTCTNGVWSTQPTCIGNFRKNNLYSAGFFEIFLIR